MGTSGALMGRSPDSNRRTAARLFVAVVIALALPGCQTTQPGDTTGTLGPAAGRHRAGPSAAGVSERYRANPKDPGIAIRYAQALRESGRQWEAVAVLERAALHNARHSALLGAYGCALAEAGDYQHAFEVFGRAHGTDQPDWRILSAQGAVLDAMGRHEEAQRYYGTALRMAPSEPSVLSNLGLSYALAKDLVRAETTLRQAATRSQRDLGIRQNLALIMSLHGRSSEVEGVSASPRGDQPATAALRELLARQNGWTEEGQSDKPQIRAEGT